MQQTLTLGRAVPCPPQKRPQPSERRARSDAPYQQKGGRAARTEMGPTNKSQPSGAHGVTRPTNERHTSGARAAARPVKRFPIVGIGASAGGLEAFTQLLQHLPADTEMGFVLVQHLDPSRTSMMPELLQRFTSMKVVQAKAAGRADSRTLSAEVQKQLAL